MKKTFIYALIDPRNNEVRYIGKANNPIKRYTNHYNSARDRNTHKRNWITSVRKDGHRPDLLILDEVNIDEWIFWESFYISLYKSFGFHLVNYTFGGDGSTFGNSGSFKSGNIPHNKGIPCTEETKEKIRNKLIGIPNISSYKKIIQYDLDYNVVAKYTSMKEAVLKSNGYFNITKISNCCKLIRNQHRNYIWRYDDDIAIDKKKVSLLEKSIIQYDKNFNELYTFSSIKEASINTGIFASNICLCCKLKAKSAGGFIWRYK